MDKIKARLKEPSSYSGIAAILAMCGIIVPNSTWQMLCLIGCGIAGAAGFWMSEKKK
jgi:uncharacterized membrane protein YccC|tara:strand:- start:281 stop:451 length:171 start_codon:yes stop_codon:yes gene_type:complete